MRRPGSGQVSAAGNGPAGGGGSDPPSPLSPLLQHRPADGRQVGQRELGPPVLGVGRGRVERFPGEPPGERLVAAVALGQRRLLDAGLVPGTTQPDMKVGPVAPPGSDLAQPFRIVRRPGPAEAALDRRVDEYARDRGVPRRGLPGPGNGNRSSFRSRGGGSSRPPRSRKFSPAPPGSTSGCPAGAARYRRRARSGASCGPTSSVPPRGWLMSPT